MLRFLTVTACLLIPVISFAAEADCKRLRIFTLSDGHRVCLNGLSKTEINDIPAIMMSAYSLAFDDPSETELEARAFELCGEFQHRLLWAAEMFRVDAQTFKIQQILNWKTDDEGMARITNEFITEVDAQCRGI